MLGLSITTTYALWAVAAGLAIWLVVAVLPWLVAPNRPHRTWFQRTVLAVNLLVIGVALTAASSLEWFGDRLAAIPRIELGADILGEETQPGEAQNILIVGSDSRDGIGSDDPNAAGFLGEAVHGIRTDTILVLRVVPDSTEAHLISFPRDLWLEIPGTGGRNRINQAVQIGGPELLIRTIESNFSIPIHHYLQVDFVGFRELVGILNGIPMFFPDSVRDTRTGLFVSAGRGGRCVTLDGDQALAFVRSRAFQTLDESGRWQTDPTGDLGRISRQQQFLRLTLERAIERGARNPTELQRFVELGVGHVVLDERLTIREMLDLGDQFSDFESDDLRTYSLPVEAGSVGAASVVFLLEEEAQDELNVFRGVSNLIPTPEAVRVMVRNGSGASGQGTAVSRDLQSVGFSVVGTGNADRFDYGRTVLRHGPDDLLPAVFVALFLDADPVFEEVEGLGPATVELVTGDDYVGIRDVPLELDAFEEVLARSTTTTTTTVPASPSTTATTSTTSTTVIGAVPEQPSSRRC